MLKPYGNRVLIKTDGFVELKDSTIVLLDSSKEKSYTGIIESVSEDLESKNWTGKRVMYSRYAGTDFTDEGQEYKILKESEILGFVE